MRSGSYDIYAQKVSSSGSVKWITNGLRICDAYNSQGYPKICSDGAGGAVIAWVDDRAGVSENDIYSQRIGISAIPWADLISLSILMQYGGLLEDISRMVWLLQKIR